MPAFRGHDDKKEKTAPAARASRGHNILEFAAVAGYAQRIPT
jgi:hypothetical protein